MENAPCNEEIEMSAITVTRETRPAGGRYVAHVAGIPDEAELTYFHDREGVLVAEHTFAPDTMRGTGVAKALVERLVADARIERVKVVANCPYVRSQVARHPEWADVIAA
jgi:predicted GNAT family acetyltransferase